MLDPMDAVGEPQPQADETWDEHYRDERDAAYLYRALAAVETDPHLRELFDKLAIVEDEHVARWEELFQASGRPLPPYRTATRTRLLAWVARRFGTAMVLPMMLAEEGREVQAYLGMARQSAQSRRRTPRRWKSPTIRRCMPGRWPRRWAATASRGTSAAPADTCAAWSTGSTTG